MLTRPFEDEEEETQVLREHAATLFMANHSFFRRREHPYSLVQLGEYATFPAIISPTRCIISQDRYTGEARWASCSAIARSYDPVTEEEYLLSLLDS